MESQNETQRIGAVIVAKSGRLSKERGRERDAMWKRRSRFNRRKIRTMSTKGRKRTLLLETAHFTSESALISSRENVDAESLESTRRERGHRKRGKKKRERERIGPRETKTKATMSGVEREEEKQTPRNRRPSAATNEFHSRPTHVNKRKLKKLFM